MRPQTASARWRQDFFLPVICLGLEVRTTCAGRATFDACLLSLDSAEETQKAQCLRKNLVTNGIRQRASIRSEV